MSLSTELPAECLHEIISHLTNDSSALNKCIRANRLFARLTVPLLYINPWRYFEVATEDDGELKSVTDPRGPLLIRTYLDCLYEMAEELSDHSSESPPVIASKTTSLNYIAFTRHVD